MGGVSLPSTRRRARTQTPAREYAQTHADRRLASVRWLPLVGVFGMLREEVLYGCGMKKRILKSVMNWVGDGVLWIGVLAAASGGGLLLEAIVDTVRFGHPR